MATIAELLGLEVEAEPAGPPCPKCGQPLPVDAEWQPLPAPPGRLRAFKLVHARPGGGDCCIYAGGPLPEGGRDR